MSRKRSEANDSRETAGCVVAKCREGLRTPGSAHSHTVALGGDLDVMHQYQLARQATIHSRAF